MTGQYPATDRHLNALAERVAALRGITVACAPPGFGKSALFRMAETLADPERSRTRRFDAAAHRLNPLAAADAIASASADETIIVDSLRGVDARALSDALALRFSGWEPPRVWVACYHLKQLALARFVADGTATIVDWRNLRLTDVEMRERVGGMPPRFRRVLADLAQNWPAACSLLCQWAQRAAPEEADWDAATILAVSGLEEYLDQEIAPLLAAEELEALVQASIVETIELGSTARRLTRPQDMQAILRANMKMAGLIERRENRLNIHPALRQWLVTRFEALPRPSQVDALALAARDSASKGDLVAAARLFRRASMHEEIERLVVDHGSLLIWVTHGFSAIEEIVDQAGHGAVMRSPVLQLMRCVVLMKTGRISDARQLFATINADRFVETPEHERDWEIIRVTLLVYGCGLQEEGDLARFRSIVTRTAQEPGWKSLLATLSCILNAQHGHFDAARANLIDARAHARSADSRYNLMFLLLHEANICLAQGDLKNARVSLGDARKRWRREFADDRGAETVMSALSASLEYELGQLTSARSSVRKSAFRMPDSEAWFDIYAAAYEPMARLIGADHGLGTAHEALAEQRRKLVAQGLPRVAALLQNLAIVLTGEAWLRGDAGTTNTWEELAPVEATATWQEQETFQLASAYVAMMGGRAEEAERSLREALKLGDKRKLARSSLRYRLLLATLMLRRGSPQARDELRRAVLLGARLGARQVFMHIMSEDLAGALRELAEEAEGRQSAVTRFVRALRTKVRMADASSGPVLSAREVEVLSALSEGGSDKVIGRVLEMSEHGVRFHLKSIYRKLNVHDRLSAVHRARELRAI